MSNPKQKEGLLSTTADEQIIIFDPFSDQSHCLNPAAGRVWEMCDGHHDRNDMIRELRRDAEALSVDAGDVEAVVDTVLEMLTEQNLLTVQTGMDRRDFGRRFLKPGIAAALMITLYVPSRDAHAS